MAQVPINTLYQRFRKGLKPLAQHFWDVFDSYWHKEESIPSAKIDGLQTLLNNKMDKKAVVTADQVGIYDPAKNYVHDAQKAEYVSFANLSSPTEQFKTEKFYRLKEDAPAGENPETHPAHWAYQGTTIGEITIDDVIGLREELDDIKDNGGSGGTTDHSALSNRDVAGAHPLSAITPEAGKANKIPVISADGTVIGYTEFTAQQIVQLAAMDVSDWLNQEQRLIMAKNDNGTAVFEGAAELLDIVAPSEAKTSLTNKSNWVDDWKILTGENYRGEIGRTGQRIMLDDGTLCTCEDSVQGTEGGANGSATYKRNISANVLDPDNNTQDATVCDLLDPSRAGGLIDDGWIDNLKVIAQPTRLDARWKAAGGYMYWCYAIIGSNSYWMRLGSPQIKYRAINSITHPTLTGNLTAHDFVTNGWYAEQVGDESAIQDQTWADASNERYYIKITSTKWKLA